MNKAQFRGVRLQLGFTPLAMGEALGCTNATITRLEAGIPSMGERFHSRSMKLDHIVSFACAWMLLNGGPMIPWQRSEDHLKVRAFKEFHQMTIEELAALFDAAPRTIRYALNPQETRGLSRMQMMALCWMRIFGSRDPFASPMHHLYDAEAAAQCPMRIDPAPVVALRPIVP